MSTLRLPVMMTPEDIKSRGQELAELCEEISEAELEEAQRKKDVKNRIEILTERRDALSRMINLRTEMREVEVEERFDYAMSRARTYRLDTGEEIGDRPMLEAEHQMDVFKRAGEHRRAGGDATLPPAISSTTEAG